MTKTLNVRIPMVPTVVRVEQGSQEMELHVKVVTDSISRHPCDNTFNAGTERVTSICRFR